MLETIDARPSVSSLTPATIHCPNCGRHAERHYLDNVGEMTRTQCPHCDYLMVMCLKTGRVFEAYAPGIYYGR